MKNKADATFLNSYDIDENKFVRIAVIPCKPGNGVECASKEETDKFYREE